VAGGAFATLDSPWLNSVRDALRQQRLAAELDHTDVRMRLGQHAGLLAELSERAEAYPVDERVSAQLMLALHRSGRTDDALTHYEATRRRRLRCIGGSAAALSPNLRRAQIAWASSVKATAMRNAGCVSSPSS
jgi:DNA-binding SARP family transcriptional activator